MDAQLSKRIKEISKEILMDFDAFCKEHHLEYHLSYGTLLGAVRHGGFIPWDDDVDVSMPREDYEKLYNLWKSDPKNTDFSCCKTQKGNCIYFPMTLIRHNNTTCVYEHSKDFDICHGMKIDVDFLDGVPSSRILQIKQKFFARLYGLFVTQRVPNLASKLVRFIAWSLLKIIRSNKMRDKIWMYSEKQMKKYHFKDCDYVRYMGSPISKREWYDDVVYFDFEGYKMPVPIGYDIILRREYGDYMQYPPVDKRKPITKVVFYDLNNSYKKYKGKYYCEK